MGLFKSSVFSFMTFISLVVIALGVYYAIRSGSESQYTTIAIVTLAVGGVAFLVFYKLI